MEAMERSYVYLLMLALIALCPVQAQRNNTKMSYVCPPDFVRLGHSCYYFSEKEATWQSALEHCRAKDSNLSVPARWEDRHLRKYLNNGIKKESRWIGGIYDYATRGWRWGGELRSMHYQSFSKMQKLTPDELQMHCIAMIPELWFRWAPRICIDELHFICQTKLRKVSKAKVKELHRRWERMGKLNEIVAPAISREVFDPMVNDVTVNPLTNPKSFDLRPRAQKRGRANIRSRNSKANELRRRARPTGRSRLTRPFPGYTWNRADPEGSYNRNAELLRSGRTGLSTQQVNGHLARIKHLRDRQLRRRRMRNRSDWLVNEPRRKPALAQAHARTYTLDNNISALHPKTIVEEFDMFPQPPETIAVPRPARNID